MFQALSNSIQFPHWVEPDSRWRQLELYDLLLDGKFYDKLPHHFYEEEDRQGRAIPLMTRRPSVQYRLPRYVARWAARKLFAGRHAPKIRAKDDAAALTARSIASAANLWSKMFDAAYRGSVGSVAVTFRIDGDKCGLKVWRSVLCSPAFDDFGELVNLRVHYVTSGAVLVAAGIPVDDPNQEYWFIRDYGQEQEITYAPPRKVDWNPLKGVDGLAPALETKHGLGFVPGIWIANPGASAGPDGPALWEDAIPNTIEIDYLLSQAARGARYNCAPQLVTTGQILNLGENTLVRGPQTYLAFDAARKDQQGNVLGEGGAKLLEMDGGGMKAALEAADRLKHLALEQIGAIQKEPSELPAPLSGRAMEFLDEDAHDVVMQWRTTYGDGGALQLLRKILTAMDAKIDPKSIWLQWPRIYQPTPDDMVKIVTALGMAIKPIEVGKPNEQGVVKTLPPLMDAKTAREYLEANLDLSIIEDSNAQEGPGDVSDELPEISQIESNPYWTLSPPSGSDFPNFP